MNFLKEFSEMVSEEKKKRYDKVETELQDSVKSKQKMSSGSWKTLDEHEKDMANLYSLGSVSKARGLYYDKNSHKGTLGNIYDPGKV